jgi:hypothetical protein
MADPYRVVLTEEQRAALRPLVGTGIAPARMRTRARILRNAHHGERGPAGVGRRHRRRARRRSEHRLARPAPARDRRTGADADAPAAGSRRRANGGWQRRSAADRACLRGGAKRPCAVASAPVGGRTGPAGGGGGDLRRNRPSDAQKTTARRGCLSNGVSRRPPLPPTPGRHDPAYVRGGVAHRLLVTEPRRGWRQVRVRQQRTRRDSAHGVKEALDVHEPDADQVVLVVDQRTTPAPASRSAAFPAAEAKRLADRLDIHSTPKQGRWRTMAERELAVPRRQCRRQRRPDQPTMVRMVAAWTTRRNAADAATDWPCTTADARIKLRRRYPAFVR